MSDGGQVESRHIGFSCRVCDTRLYARTEHVGRKVKCPDCGGVNSVPPPQKEAPYRPPEALEGEQYEVWGVHEQPTAAQLRASMPKSISFECSLCQTRLTVSINLVEQLFGCPDCGAKTRVPQPEETADSFWREGEDQELALDEVVRPETMPRHTSPVLDDVDEQRRRPLRYEAADSTRPPLARFPLQTKVLSFPFSKGARLRLVIFTTWALFVAWLLVTALGFMTMQYGAFITMFALAADVILAMMLLASLAACWIVIITESSEGNNVIQAWPDMVFLDWMFDGFYVLMAGFVSAMPGWAMGLLFEEHSIQWWLSIGIGLVISFPVVLLSMMDYGSPFAPLSPMVLMNLLSRPFSWFVFTLETGLIAAGVVALTIVLGSVSTMLATAAAPVAVLASFWYFRLLGRLAWILSEATRGE